MFYDLHLSRRIGASILGAFCAAMGINAISNATELLAVRYQVSLSELSPATSLYLLAEIAALPLVPIAIKRLGAQRLLYLALGGFLLATLCCMLTQTINQLILSRALQGFFGGALLILPGLLIKLETPPDKQTQTLTFLSLASACAPITGPLLTAGLNSDSAHLIFVVMASIILIALLLTPSHTEPRPNNITLPKLDMLMIALFCSGLMIVVWGMENIQEWGGWHDLRVQAHAFIGLGLITFAGLHQWGREKALLPLHVLADLRYLGILISGLLIGIILYGFIYIIPYYLIRVHQAGVVQLFQVALYVAIPQLLCLPLMLYLRNRLPTYLLACTGTAVCALSVWQLTGIGVDFNASHWALPQGLRALAVPMIVLPLSLLLVKLPSPQDAPAMSSLFGVFRTLGGVIGISGLTVYTDSKQSAYEQLIMMNRGVGSVSAQEISQQSWLYAFNDTFTLVSSMLVCMLFFFIFLAKTQPSHR